jgi:hypothetical protein
LKSAKKRYFWSKHTKNWIFGQYFNVKLQHRLKHIEAVLVELEWFFNRIQRMTRSAWRLPKPPEISQV